jgi:hypothetical protein
MPVTLGLESEVPRHHSQWLSLLQHTVCYVDVIEPFYFRADRGLRLLANTY